MAKVTRIKASDGPRTEESDEPAVTRKKVVVKDKKSEKTKREKVKKAEKELVSEAGVDKASRKDGKKKPFILIRPFVALFQYLKGSWQELRQVRWPNRKATWKMVLAVLVYTIIFIAFIMLLDWFFTWLFGIILG